MSLIFRSFVLRKEIPVGFKRTMEEKTFKNIVREFAIHPFHPYEMDAATMATLESLFIKRGNRKKS